MKSLFRTLALYNRWANDRLYAELARLTQEQRDAVSEVNFGSITAIANHLVLADRLWLNRFTASGSPVTTVDAVPYPALPELDAARRIEEDRAITFSQNLIPARLADTLVYTTTEGAAMALPLTMCLAHFFNHQTHHRGQIHALLGINGIKAVDIDLLGFEREQGAYTELHSTQQS